MKVPCPDFFKYRGRGLSFISICPFGSYRWPFFAKNGALQRKNFIYTLLVPGCLKLLHNCHRFKPIHIYNSEFVTIYQNNTPHKISCFFTVTMKIQSH